MTEVMTTMVDVCDRLLLLLTGKGALKSAAEQEPVLEAIELLGQLEGHLKSCANTPLPPLAEEALATLVHRTKTLELINDVIVVLHEQGLIPTGK